MATELFDPTAFQLIHEFPILCKQKAYLKPSLAALEISRSTNRAPTLLMNRDIPVIMPIIADNEADLIDTELRAVIVMCSVFQKQIKAVSYSNCLSILRILKVLLLGLLIKELVLGL